MTRKFLLCLMAIGSLASPIAAQIKAPIAAQIKAPIAAQIKAPIAAQSKEPVQVAGIRTRRTNRNRWYRRFLRLAGHPQWGGHDHVP
jgi:hypothetical protein